MSIFFSLLEMVLHSEEVLGGPDKTGPRDVPSHTIIHPSGRGDLCAGRAAQTWHIDHV